MDPIFLPLDFILYIHKREAALTNSPLIIRDQGGLEAALAAPQASFGGQYLMDLFEMAATYVPPSPSITLSWMAISGSLRRAHWLSFL
jgi:prophage maintenance system killer protein